MTEVYSDDEIVEAIKINDTTGALMKRHTACPLCGSKATLKESHIMSKSVLQLAGRYGRPNEKNIYTSAASVCRKMFCGKNIPIDCEDARFSKSEGVFVDSFLIPFLDAKDSALELHYGK